MSVAAPTPAPSLVAIDRFILATRDSGYQGTAAAVCELVDNAIQAGARRVWIQIDEEQAPLPLRVRVQDDGEGMDPGQLQEALRFGGSSRFGDRGGLGRYGMGLPNASLSQARRLEVLSWQGGAARRVCLDLDEVATGRQVAVASPLVEPCPPLVAEPRGPTGTLVIWRRCDRLDLKRPAALARRLTAHLARVFRFYLWDGLELQVNGAPAAPVDPLMLHLGSPEPGASAYGEPLTYDVSLPWDGGGVLRGRVEVRFSELPVPAWHGCSNEAKRELGITGGPVVSVVRARREIDAGWFFMGAKRRENYDDWWRCEVQFEPTLDELFGVTHTKQQIRPTQAALDLLAPELEQVARALNGRARRAHEGVELQARLAPAEAQAVRCERRLPPLPPLHPEDRARAHALLAAHPSPPRPPPSSGLGYTLLATPTSGPAAFQPARDDTRVLCALNTLHPLVVQALGPDGRGGTERLLLAMAREELAAPLKDREALAAFRERWGATLTELLKEPSTVAPPRGCP